MCTAIGTAARRDDVAAPVEMPLDSEACGCWSEHPVASVAFHVDRLHFELLADRGVVSGHRRAALVLLLLCLPLSSPVHVPC